MSALVSFLVLRRHHQNEESFDGRAVTNSTKNACNAFSLLSRHQVSRGQVAHETISALVFVVKHTMNVA